MHILASVPPRYNQVMTRSATQLTTADELFRMPSGKVRRELVNGEIRTVAPVGSEHGYIAIRLARVLANHVENKRLGAVFAAETGYVISRKPDTVRAPDVSFVSRKRIPKTGIPKFYWEGPPDLAAEVVSPGDTINEVTDKVKMWLEAGTKLVWVVDPHMKTITIYRSPRKLRIIGIDDVLEGEDVVPGFECKVSDIF